MIQTTLRLNRTNSKHSNKNSKIQTLDSSSPNLSQSFSKMMSFCKSDSKSDNKMSRIAVDEIASRVSTYFNNPELSDVVFEFEVDNKLYAHRSYLCMVSEYLRAQLSDNWLQKDTIRIEHYSYRAFSTYLAFLYQTTYEINDDNVVELADLAHCFMEKHLLDTCESFLIRRMTTENCARLYPLAKRYRLEKLYAQLGCHVMQNATSIALSESYAKLEPELCKSLWPDAANIVTKIRNQPQSRKISFGDFVDLTPDDF